MALLLGVAAGCGRDKDGEREPQLTMYSGALSAAGVTFNASGHEMHLCLAGPAVGDTCTIPTNLPTLTDGQYTLYTYASYGGTGAWAPYMVTMTVANGELNVPENPYLKVVGSTLVLQTRPITVVAEGYRSHFTFDWAKIASFPRPNVPPEQQYRFTVQAIVGRRYMLFDIGSNNIDPAAGLYSFGPAVPEIFIGETANALDVGDGVKQSFTWDPDNRTLTGKVKTVNVDMDGYKGTFGIGGEYKHGPNGIELHTLPNRRYYTYDYGSNEPANGGYYFAPTADLVMDGNGVITIGTQGSRHLEVLPNGHIRLKLGTIQLASWNGYAYFLGMELGVGGGSGTNGPTGKAILGRRYYFYPDYFTFTFTEAGTCSQTTFTSATWGGTATIDCKPPAPPAPPGPPPSRPPSLAVAFESTGPTPRLAKTPSKYNAHAPVRHWTMSGKNFPSRRERPPTRTRTSNSPRRTSIESGSSPRGARRQPRSREWSARRRLQHA